MKWAGMWQVSDRKQVDAEFRLKNIWEIENLENIDLHREDDKTKVSLQAIR
jgi:hypothetical protein